MALTSIVLAAAGAALMLPGAAAANHSVTNLQSTGPSGGNGPQDSNFSGMSSDAARVVLTTADPLVAADTDSQTDVYERTAGTTNLVSTGPTGGNGAFGAQFGGMSKNGKRIFFDTRETLTSADTDDDTDVYERFAGNTTLVSTGPASSGSQDSFFRGVSEDGTRIWFVSYESLVAEDQDSGRKDLYERYAGVTTLVSTGPQNANALLEADFDGATLNGSAVFFHTDAALTAEDTDSVSDVYERETSATTLVSTSTYSANGPQPAFFEDVAADGSPVFFSTTEALAPSDTDSFLDVYQSAAGVTEHVSTGPSGGNAPYHASYGGASLDGTRVFFSTRDALVSGDTDGQCDDAAGQPLLPCTDVYERSGGATTLISTSTLNANASDDAFFSAASQEGGRVFFETTAAFAAADTDGSYPDVYERIDGTTAWTSTGPAAQNGPHSSELSAISPDGTRAFFGTYEKMTSDDLDANWQDIYERAGGSTTLISTGPAVEHLPSVTLVGGVSLDGTRVVFQTEDRLASGDTDGNYDVYSREAPITGFPRSKSATPLQLALVPAFRACTAPDRMHAAPLGFPSCANPQAEASVLTLGTADHNGLAPNSSSYVRLVAVGGSLPSDSDISALIHVNDVRCGPSGGVACPGGPTADFTGTLVLRATIRLTDRSNGPANDAATVQNWPLDFPVQCVATPPDEGATCDTTTTLNSLMPGAVIEGRRENFEVGQMRVYDPGPNGTGFGAGCPPACGDGDEGVFMRQGLFVP